MKMTKVDALNVALSALTADSYKVKYDMVDANGVPVIHIETYTQQEVREVLEKMIAQLSKPRKTSDEAKAKAKAKRADARGKMLAEVLPVLRVALTDSDGFTAKDLYDRCVDQLPADFTDKKVGYILLHEMADEVVKTEVRGKANVYKLKD